MSQNSADGFRTLEVRHWESGGGVRTRGGIRTYTKVGDPQCRSLVVGWCDDDVEMNGGGAVQPITHTDRQLIYSWLRPFAL